MKKQVLIGSNNCEAEGVCMRKEGNTGLKFRIISKVEARLQAIFHIKAWTLRKIGITRLSYEGKSGLREGNRQHIKGGDWKEARGEEGPDSRIRGWMEDLEIMDKGWKVWEFLYFFSKIPVKVKIPIGGRRSEC